MSPSCTSAELANLQTGNVYTFRVYAENAAGMGEALLGPNGVRIQNGLGRNLNSLHMKSEIFILNLKNHIFKTREPQRSATLKCLLASIRQR